MADPAGEADGGVLRLDFDRRLMLRFRGSVITSDAGLLPYRELDDAMGLTDTGADRLAETRTGETIRHLLRGLLRQSVFGRLAGYEDVNEPTGCAATRPCAGSSVTGRQWVGLPRPARWAASRPSGWLGRRTSPLLAICRQWIDAVHKRRQPRVIVLDMDSSESPTYGEQEGSAYNGHFGCTCYHPLFVFNQLGDLLERCALRPDNVHSAEGWREVLEPVVGRYRDKVKRRYFRGDAAFANPEVYEFLEAEGMGYAIRLPANRVLQDKIGHLLKRPVGQPPQEVRRYYSRFSYRAGSWNKPRRVVTKVEWHPGELYPRVGFIVTNLARPAERIVAFYNHRLQPPRHLRAVDQRRQGRDQVDPPVVPLLRRQRGSPSVARARLQPRQLHADAGDAEDGGAVVADQPAGEADQDRRQGGLPRPVRHFPDGRGRGAAADVPGNPVAHRAPSSTCASMTGRSDHMRQATTAEVRLDEGKPPSSSPARPSVSAFWLSAGWLRSNFVAAEPPGTEDYVQTGREPGECRLIVTGHVGVEIAEIDTLIGGGGWPRRGGRLGVLPVERRLRVCI
jgi:hypothetical protein